MTPWHEGRLVGFDCETTAAEPEDARIVTAAVAVVEPDPATETGFSVGEHGWIIDPGVPIPDEAAAIHGITTGRAQEEGEPAVDGLAAILDRLVALLADGAALVAFNASYDLTVLDREARRHGLRPLQEAVVPLLVVDPFVIDAHLDRYRPGKRTLAAMIASYRTRIDTAHDAHSDALAACRLAFAQGKRGRIIRRVRDQQEAAEFEALVAEWKAVRDDLRALHDAQVVWAADRRRDLAAYFKRIGQEKHVPTDWPLIPLPEHEQGALL